MSFHSWWVGIIFCFLSYLINMFYDYLLQVPDSRNTGEFSLHIKATGDWSGELLTTKEVILIYNNYLHPLMVLS